jgi:uncharacterized membrane protein YgcG
MTCLMLLFLISLVILRVITEQAAPTMVRFPLPLYHVGRILFAFLGAVTVTAFLLLCFHVAPVNKHIFGKMTYDSQNPWGQAIDHKFLAFVQYSSGHIFSSHEEGRNPSDDEFRNIRVFDPKGSWLIDHQNARIGEGKVPESSDSGAPSGGGDESSGGDAGAGASGSRTAQGDGPGIPGGTAGAAAGLAPTNP